MERPYSPKYTKLKHSLIEYMEGHVMVGHDLLIERNCHLHKLHVCNLSSAFCLQPSFEEWNTDY